MEQMHQMLQNVQHSMEAKEIEIKQVKAEVDIYNAETNRIKATMEGWTPEQIQDIVMGTLHAAIDTGDVIGRMSQQMMPMGEETMESPAMEANESVQGEQNEQGL
jgi:hypothetical protein